MKWTSVVSILAAQGAAVHGLTISVSAALPTTSTSVSIANPTALPPLVCPPNPVFPLPITSDRCVLGCVADFIKALQAASTLVCPAIYPPPPYCSRPVEKAVTALRQCVLGCGRFNVPLPTTADLLSVVFCPLEVEAVA
ncbi:hypothetical protein LQW54_007412 [Pestalotiopsis sp. IQ-011]